MLADADRPEIRAVVQDQLAQKTALSRQTVNKKLKWAEKLGLIEIPKHKSANQKWANNVYLLPKAFVKNVSPCD